MSFLPASSSRPLNAPDLGSPERSAGPDIRNRPARPLRIGVFDSGLGGLTVLRALFTRIPGADYLYLGDTARLPYGSKSQETIARYAVSSARFLVGEGAQFLTVACNTASALALDEMRAAAAPVPVLGVIETGANAARTFSRSGDVLVIATAATVESHAYRRACQERGLRAIEKACPLLVPLVEEGWTEHPVTDEIVAIYLRELLDAAHGGEPPLAPDTLLLGCTHYPLLRGPIERAIARHHAVDSAAPAIAVIDSAAVTAQEVAGLLGIPPSAESAAPPACRFYATDSIERFRQLGARFLPQPLESVEHVDLGG